MGRLRPVLDRRRGGRAVAVAERSAARRASAEVASRHAHNLTDSPLQLRRSPCPVPVGKPMRGGVRQRTDRFKPGHDIRHGASDSSHATEPPALSVQLPWYPHDSVQDPEETTAGYAGCAPVPVARADRGHRGARQGASGAAGACATSIEACRRANRQRPWRLTGLAPRGRAM